MSSNLKLIQILLLCTFCSRAALTADLDLQIEVKQNEHSLFKTIILIQESFKEISQNPTNDNTWRLLNTGQSAEEASHIRKASRTEQTAEPIDMSKEANIWRLLNTGQPIEESLNIPIEVHKEQALDETIWRLLNKAKPIEPNSRPTKKPTWQLVDNSQKQNTIKGNRIHFPKEDANQPSLHEFHPTTTLIARTTTSPTPLETQPFTSTPTKSQSNNIQHKFNEKLFKVLAPRFSQKNLIYSPISLETNLALLYFGSEGRTAVQFQDGLGFPQPPAELAQQIQESLGESNIKTSDFKFLIASKIYYSDDLILDPKIKQAAVKYFHSELEGISFKQNAIAAENINQWVADKTEQRIKNIVDAQILDAQTQAVLVNAIYLKAKWANEFSLSDTDRMDFYLQNGLQHAKLVEMMYTEEDFNYGEFPELNANIVELPFLDSDLSMLIIVPNEIDGLMDVERRLMMENLNELVTKMEMKTVTLRLPKFKIEAEIDMMEPLEKLGVSNIFTTNAELGKIFVDNPNVQVSKILHKAYIEVNEGGVEAAAASYNQIVPLSLEPRMIYLTVDHPFIFAIRSRHTVHFVGHVYDNFQ